MKPELKVLTPKDAPKPEGHGDMLPAQSEMPFAVVDGEPVCHVSAGGTTDTDGVARVAKLRLAQKRLTQAPELCEVANGGKCTEQADTASSLAVAA